MLWWRIRGLVVRALGLYSGGPGFKSSSLPQGGFVFDGPRLTPLRFVNTQLVSLPPVGIFKKFLFNLQYLFAHFNVFNYHSSAED